MRNPPGEYKACVAEASFLSSQTLSSFPQRMSIVLGSVSQRLKGCMPLKLGLLLVLCTLLLADVASGMFYTNSKEHDYPRIGRRSGSHKDTGALADSGEHELYRQLPLNRMPMKRRIRVPSASIFRAWDKDGDGYISLREFIPRIDRHLGREP